METSTGATGAQSFLALKSNMAVRSVLFNFKTLSRLCLVVVEQSKTNKSYFTYDFTNSQLLHRTELRLGETGLMRRTTSMLTTRGTDGSSGIARLARTRFLSLSIIRGLKHGGQEKQGKVFRSNQNIKAKEIRLIDQEGKNLGIMALKKALEVGNETKCLVVEVGTSGSETVCKLISEKQLYDKEKKKNFKTTKTKEIKVTGKISDHDLEIKLKKMREFLEGRNSVKVFVAHRKRQNTSLDDKQAVIDNITKHISDVGSLQGHAKPVGKGLRCMFIPTSS